MQVFLHVDLHEKHLRPNYTNRKYPFSPCLVDLFGIQYLNMLETLWHWNLINMLS